MASKFPSVGAVVPWARGNVGAVATQSLANVPTAPRASSGWPPAATPSRWSPTLTGPDDMREERQLGVVDGHGGSATFTGGDCVDWAGGRTGPCYAAQGNILTGPEVVDALVEVFLATQGTLAERMLAALLAADRAGGDRRGRQSAALVVRRDGGGYGGNNDILLDLRVDDHADPVPELGRIHGIHDLLFGKTPADEFLPIEGQLATEMTERLSRIGHASLQEWADIENLEERLDPSGKTIDPVVLRLLRETTATS